MCTAVISACLPVLRPVFVSCFRLVGLSQVVSSTRDRSKGISLPDRLDHKGEGTAPLASRASINREEMVWTHIGHAAKSSDADDCSCDGDDHTISCQKIHSKGGVNLTCIKTTEVHQKYESRKRTGSDASQKQPHVQTFSVV